MAADTLLASDLRLEVDNAAGSSDHGALRLGANCKGPNGLIKARRSVQDHPGKRGIAYRVEASSDLVHWDRVLFDSRTDWPVGWTRDRCRGPTPKAKPVVSPGSSVGRG